MVYIISIILGTGPPTGFRGPGARLQNKGPSVCDRSKKGQKARESGELNLEVLKHCRLFLFGGSLNTSIKALNKYFDIS